MLQQSVNTIPACVVTEPALSKADFDLAAQECALAFPYVNFGTLPVWMQTVWLEDARERQAGQLNHIPCPVD